MSNMPYPPHRFVRCLGWAFVALVLSGASTVAAPQTDQASSQSVVVQTQAGAAPDANRQSVEDVSNALRQRLDRMLLDSQPPTTR
jgi:hypothetical protein